MSRLRKPIYGVGVNDAEYPTMGFTVGYTTGGKPQRIEGKCPFYSRWVGMLQRCYSPVYQDLYKNYKGCSVAPEWLTFSAFSTWMQLQDWEGNQLDKDILVPGNKIYSAETCLFIPAQVNRFLTGSETARGAWPLGVTYAKEAARAKRFVACGGNPFTGQRNALGAFSTPEEAHEAWRANKHRHALELADLQTDPRIAQALRARFAPKNN